MNPFSSLFLIELKRRKNAKDIIILILVGLFLLVAVQCGRQNYLDIQQKKELFRETEATKVNEYTMYRQYGYVGLRLMFVPSPFSILDNSADLSGPIAHFNTAEKLTLYTSLKGRNFFSDKSVYMSVLGVVPLIGIFLALIYGHSTTAKSNYLKLLASIFGQFKSFWRLYLTRLLMLNAGLVSMLLIPLLWLLKDGIQLFRLPLIYIAAGMVLTITFFFSAGCVVGTMSRQSTRAVTLAAIYFLSVLFIPWMSGQAAQADARDIEPLFNFQLTNLKIIMSIETKLIDQFGILDDSQKPSPEAIAEIKAAVKNEHGLVRERERQMRRLMLDKLRRHQMISSLFPVLFYFSINHEAATRGGLSFLDFYSYCEQKKAEFIDFYVQNRFFEHHVKGRNVEPFFEGDENLFYARSRLPFYFPFGIAVTLVYILILSFFAYFRFKRGHIRSLKKRGDSNSAFMLDIDIKPGKLNFLLTGDPAIKNQVYRFFTGKDYGPVIKVNGEDIRSGGFVYLPNPSSLPAQLEFPSGDGPLWKDLYTYARNTGKPVILDDYFTPLKPDEIEFIRGDIIANNVSTLYISQDEYLAYSIAQNLIFSENDDTVQPVRILKTHTEGY